MTSPIEFTIGEHTYRAARLPAKKQFHVARRLAPVVGIMGPILRSGLLPALRSGGAIDELLKTVADELLQPIAETIAKLSDEDCDYVLDTCLSTVQRKSGQGWAPIMAHGGDMMFKDIELPTMMQIAARVIMDNLAPFFAALPSASLTGAGQPST